jgi:small subunit ribosomal protein S6
MANYELMMILNPSVGEENITASIDVVKKELSEANATIVKEDIWGEKKLSYKIKSSDTGYYVLWTLELDGKTIKPMNNTFNLDQNIWRYMFVNLDA